MMAAPGCARPCKPSTSTPPNNAACSTSCATHLHCAKRSAGARVADALQLDPQLTPKQRRRQRRAILKDFAAIWQTKDYATALRRYLRICRHYRQSQPAAVATLRRDFRSTVTYYQIERQYPSWPRACLRTTSYLERLNRRFRQRTPALAPERSAGASVRSANAYHSDEGVLAMVAQEADQAFRPGRRCQHKPAT